MEFALLATLGMAGYFANDTDENKLSNNETKILNTINNKKKLKHKEQTTINEKKIIENYSDDLFDVSEKLTNNVNSIDEILKKNNNENILSFFKNGVDNPNKSYDRYQRFTDHKKSRELINGQKKSYDNNYTDNISNSDERGNNNSDYLNYFNPLTFDSNGPPGAINDIYSSDNKDLLEIIKKNISLNGGWSQYTNNGSLSYGLVPDSELTHNNMVPFFSAKKGYGSNDIDSQNVMKRKNEIFTGVFEDTWTKKKKLVGFFLLILMKLILMELKYILKMI